MEKEEWFKLKRYPHIGKPITLRDYTWVSEYVKNAKSVKRHSFVPFIHRKIVKRKYRPDISSSKRNPSGKRTRKIGKPKNRKIYYASHLDSLVFSYYNHLLSKAYESFLVPKNYNEAVVAYRKIPISEGATKNKCNIDFAKSSFEFIRERQDKKLTVIVADITSFFDNLNHKVLKEQWYKVLGRKTLPPDHYNLYKTLTRIKYVNGNQLFNSYNRTMLVERPLPNMPSKKQRLRVSLKSSKYFKEKNCIAYCSKDEFIGNNLNLIVSLNNTKGIPQGTPISATLANIYMIDFDQIVYDQINSISGFYQRYSDDLIIVCEQKDEDATIKFIRKQICSLAKLEIAVEKTKVYRFESIKGKFTGFEIDENTKVANHSKTLGYLGFTYDGQRVLIKNSGFSKFYRSMKRAFKVSTSMAIHSKNPDKSIFKAKLYKRFTHRGSKRKLIYRPSKKDPTIYEKTKQYYWGNYISYINKANDSMNSINNNNEIKKQSNRFWKKFHLLMKASEKKIKRQLYWKSLKKG